jgi:hypothetical protein
MIISLAKFHTPDGCSVLDSISMHMSNCTAGYGHFFRRDHCCAVLSCYSESLEECYSQIRHTDSSFHFIMIKISIKFCVLILFMFIVKQNLIFSSCSSGFGSGFESVGIIVKHYCTVQLVTGFRGAFVFCPYLRIYQKGLFGYSRKGRKKWVENLVARSLLIKRVLTRHNSKNVRQYNQKMNHF